ncbi:hypothetical protein FisN_36Hu002 [Fistulifera solaris]|jgi:hypothetical protein|uniref:Uncharacterized protein n=1 Tax=Fistulifera solaris TaxID=1519565 RepID=A0A1Z5KT75_FISSO|nr:hypothetical protein FisN_36Hu002 [Fistulifera solaris]|eukprot:GAX29509.1 hypothetical protein FisN_36Hu002 [Fistulifera solaris]
MDLLDDIFRFAKPSTHQNLFIRNHHKKTESIVSFCEVHQAGWTTALRKELRPGFVVLPKMEAHYHQSEFAMFRH